MATIAQTDDARPFPKTYFPILIHLLIYRQAAEAKVIYSGFM